MIDSIGEIGRLAGVQPHPSFKRSTVDSDVEKCHTESKCRQWLLKKDGPKVFMANGSCEVE